MTYEYGFEKPAGWSDADVVAHATLANESDEGYEEVAVVEVTAIGPSSEGAA